MSNRRFWSNQDQDLLLDLFIYSNIGVTDPADRRRYEKRLHRSWTRIQAQLWKLSCRYDRLSVRDYIPVNRHPMDSFTFSNHDKIILSIATSKIGIENEAYQTEWLSKLLCKTTKQIGEYMLEVCMSTLLPGIMDVNSDLVARAKVVHRVMSPVYSAFISSGSV